MLLVVGWDGACIETMRRLAPGRTPVFDALAARGVLRRVRSTTPPVTFPAWTSFLTAAEPDWHGITDFTIPRRDTYGVRFANATQRRLPTIVRRMADAGLRVGLYGMPATWPCEGRALFEIPGFDTPLGASGADRSAHPPALAAELRRRHGRLAIEGIAQTTIDAGWHRRTRRRLLDDIELRTTISLELLAEHAPLDAFVLHFMEPDTANHHFRHFDDEASPRHRDGERGVLGDVYAALDRSLGRLLDGAGSDCDLLLLSDHGSAASSDRVLFWNRWLADAGFLAFRETRGEPASLRWKRRALAAVPSALQAKAFALATPLVERIESGARFAGIDWSRTAVYSDELPYFPSLRFNVAGREPAGIVGAGDLDALAALLTSQLLALRDPFDGGVVVEAVRRREDVYRGPFADRYPDLFLELRRPGGYAYAAASSRAGLERQWLRRLRENEQQGAKGSAMNGVHSPFGLALLAGPGAGSAARATDDCTLADLGATALALAGVAPDPSLQGRSLVTNPTAAERPAATGAGAASPLPDERPYAEHEEREVEARLRALGYLP